MVPAEGLGFFEQIDQLDPRSRRLPLRRACPPGPGRRREAPTWKPENLVRARSVTGLRSVAGGDAGRMAARKARPSMTPALSTTAKGSSWGSPFDRKQLAGGESESGHPFIRTLPGRPRSGARCMLGSVRAGCCHLDDRLGRLPRSRWPSDGRAPQVPRAPTNKREFPYNCPPPAEGSD